MQTTEEILAELSAKCEKYADRGLAGFEKLVRTRLECMALAKLCHGMGSKQALHAQTLVASAYLHSGLIAQARYHAQQILDSASLVFAVDLRPICKLTLARAALNESSFDEAWQHATDALDFVRNRPVKSSTASTEGEGQQVQRESKETDDKMAQCPALRVLADISTAKGEHKAAADKLMEIWEIEEHALGATHVSLCSLYFRLAAAFYADGNDKLCRENLGHLFDVARTNSNEKPNLYGLARTDTDDKDRTNTIPHSAHQDAKFAVHVAEARSLNACSLKRDKSLVFPDLHAARQQFIFARQIYLNVLNFANTAIHSKHVNPSSPLPASASAERLLSTATITITDVNGETKTESEQTQTHTSASVKSSEDEHTEQKEEKELSGDQQNAPPAEAAHSALSSSHSMSPLHHARFAHLVTLCGARLRKIERELTAICVELRDFEQAVDHMRCVLNWTVAASIDKRALEVGVCELTLAELCDKAGHSASTREAYTNAVSILARFKHKSEVVQSTTTSMGTQKQISVSASELYEQAKTKKREWEDAHREKNKAGDEAQVKAREDRFGDFSQFAFMTSASTSASASASAFASTTAAASLDPALFAATDDNYRDDFE